VFSPALGMISTPQKSTNSNDTPFWSIPHKPTDMSGFPHLDQEGVKTLPIGIGGTLSECLAIENKV
jgi:hypothetical protein